jgi:Na+/melibiose symporter-like transporter
MGTKEPRLRIDLKETSRARIPWVYWFRKILYYQVAMVYLLTRLVLNVSQAYLAFFVIDDLQMDQSAKALVPAIIYICSFVVSVLLQEIPWNGKRLKAYYTAGGIIWIFCGAAILLLPRDISSFMYAISVFIGIANALMMVTAISMQSVLVGAEVGGCAFVCGSLSFLDKMSCGLALYVLQSHQTTSPRGQLNNNQQSVYLSVTRYGLGLVPALCSFVGVAVTFFMELEAAGSLSKPLLREPLLE